MARLDFEQTMDRLLRLIQAGYPIIHLVSYEEARVFDCVARIVNRLRQTKQTKKLFRWSQGVGLEEFPLGPTPSTLSSSWLESVGLPKPNSPVAAQAGTETAAGALAQLLLSHKNAYSDMADCVAVFLDLHPALSAAPHGSGAMVRTLRNTATALRTYYDKNRGTDQHRYQTLIIVAPSGTVLSSELHGDVIVLDFPLPELSELQTVLEGMLSRNLLKFPTPIPSDELKGVQDADTEEAYKKRVIELLAGAGRGLNLHTYQQGLNMIQVDQQTIRLKHVDYMMQLKADTISNPALQYTPRVEIKLGGLQGIKEWVRVRSGPAISAAVRKKYRLPAPKGVMLCGASGGGKSQLAKLIAKEFNLALLRLDVGSLFASYVGESEQRTRQALQLAEVLAPVVLWIDEIDKAFAGAAGGAGDNGVSARVLGHFLTWLAEKQDDVFVVVTANRFEKILEDFPEFGRKGRFDEIFWVGLPQDDSRAQIFDIYLEPLLRDRHLVVEAADIAEIRNFARMAPVDPAAAPPAHLVAALVASSDKMTGAEIESAVNEALYQAYDRHQSNRNDRSDQLAPDLLVRVVQSSAERALYRGAESALLVAQEKSAAQRHWLDAQSGVAVVSPDQAARAGQ